MPLVKKKVIVKNSQGLYARPAAAFVQLASKFNSNVTLRRDSQEVNGKSIMGILMLAAEKDSEIHIIAEGDDAQEAVNELEELVNKNE